MKKSLLLTLLTVLWSAPLLAFKHLTPLEDSIWKHSESPYMCSLDHPIKGFGLGGFEHEAGEQRYLVLQSEGYQFAEGKVQVVSDPPAWRPQMADRLMAEVSAEDGKIMVSGDLTTQIMAELSSGMLVGFRGKLRHSEDLPFEVYLSSVGFKEAFDEFKVCEAKLLPVNYSQVERTRIQYKSGEIEIPASEKRKLDNIITYLETDQSVKQIFVDGHTDAEGLIRDNIAISEQRAIEVTNYLVERGISADMVVTRYHGEKYPVASNKTPADRAKNRRTTVRLSREAPMMPKEDPKPESDTPMEMMEGKGTDVASKSP